MPTRDAQLLFGDEIDLGSTSAGSTAQATYSVLIPQVTNHLGVATNDRPFLNRGLTFNAIIDGEVLAGSTSSATVTMNLLNYTAEITASNMASATTIISKVMTADASGSNYPIGTQIISQPLPTTILMPYLKPVFVASVAKVATGKISAWIGTPIQAGGEHGSL